MTLEARLEAILFWRAEPVAVGALAQWVKEPLPAVEAALESLAKNLTGRGVQLVRSGGVVALATHPAAAPIVEELQRGELAGDLGAAALETLATVVYRSPVTRSEIDYVRGVNSSYILRQLTARGLIERAEAAGTRGYAYQPTIELLQQLGLKDWSELPDYETARTRLAEFALTAMATEKS
jgi:segregation and condensation protein B